MPSPTDAVLEAIDRWRNKGLLDPDQAAVLKEEVEDERERSGRRFSQYVLAGTGALVLLVAVGVLADWLWPLIGVGTRSVILAAAGVGIHGLGIFLENRERKLPAAYFLQTTGLGVLLSAFMYSEEQWADATVGGVVVGFLSLATPLLAVPRALGRNPLMPAVHLALGFVFVAIFLDRSSTLTPETIIWILDGLMLAVTAVLVFRLVVVRDTARNEWALNAFVTALYVGLVLLLATAVGPLHMEGRSVWAANLWLAVVAFLTLWGLHRAPGHLRRGWFERQLGACVLLSLPLAFYTSLELLEWGEDVTALAVAAIGALGLGYGVRRSAETVLKASAVALVVAAWYYGVEKGGALGAVLALGFTAALLFWLSGRVGGPEPSEETG